MSNISDVIEQFILQVLDDSDKIQISRNDLANYFSVAPSQINYVLTTRFTLNKGFAIESKRGGGGFVCVHRVSDDEDCLLQMLAKQCDEQADSFSEAVSHQIISRLARENIIDESEYNLLKLVSANKTLPVPNNYKNALRANILREVIIDKMKKGDGENE